MLVARRWGPPGCGKTTFATIIAKSTSSVFVTLSAVSATIKDVRDVVDRAKRAHGQGRRTILFVDEIHRSSGDACVSGHTR